MHKGRPILVSAGFRTPKEVRGLHSSGLEPVVVNNVKELTALNPEKQGAIIAKIGNRKKLLLLKLALEKNISVFNVNNIEEIMKKIEESFIVRKKSKEDKSKEKSKKEEEKKKKAEEKKKKEKTEKQKNESTESSAEPVIKEEEEDKQKKDIEKTIIKKQ